MARGQKEIVKKGDRCIQNLVAGLNALMKVEKYQLILQREMRGGLKAKKLEEEWANIAADMQKSREWSCRQCIKN